MTVHIEAFLAQNLLANLPILWAAVRAYGRRARPARLVCAAAIGAVYALVSCLQGMEWLASLPMRFVAALLMAALSLGGKRMMPWIKASLFIWAATFFFGGIGLSLVTLLSSRGWSPWYAVALCAAAASLVALLFRLYDPGMGRGTAEVEIAIGRQSLRGVGFVDSGNRLLDPISGLPVAVVSRRAAEGLSLEELLEGAGLRMVAYTAVGGDGVMMAFRPDHITVYGEPLPDMLVGLSPESAPQGDWDILLPAGVRLPRRCIRRHIRGGVSRAS